MILRDFLKKLEELAAVHGDDMEIIMADNIPVANPIFSIEYPKGRNIVITDEK